MEKKLLGLFSIIIALFFCMTIYAQDAYNLEYKFTKGKTYTYQDNSSSRITQTMMGREMKINTSTKNKLSIKVEDVTSNGDGVLIFSIDSALVSSSGMGRDTTLNLTDLIGKRLEINFSKFGDLIKYTELDTLEDDSRYLSVKQEAKHFFANLNDKEVKVGGTWNSTQVDTMNTMGGELVSNVDIVYTLVGKENKLGHDCYKIQFTANLKIQGEGNMRGVDITMDGTGKSTGELYLETSNRMLVYSKNDIDTKMDIVTGGAQAMTIPMSQSTVSERTLLSD